MVEGGRQISLKDKMRKSRPPETKTKRQHAHHVRLSLAFGSVRSSVVGLKEICVSIAWVTTRTFSSQQ